MLVDPHIKPPRFRISTAGSKAIATEARKGYGLLVIGVAKTTGANGDFDEEIADLAASFQAAVIDVLAAKAARAATKRRSKNKGHSG
jgi:tRNA A37 threonylcarbamoyltransferase TsaD